MMESVFQIEHIPAVLYGAESEGVYLFVHGKCGQKEEAKDFAGTVCPRGWQVLGIDLPEHGSRKDETEAFDPWHAVPELQTVLAYVRSRWSHVALRANSIGAWFSMLACQGEPPEKALFVSPILDMERLIGRMMQWAGVTEGELKARTTVETGFGETLSWRYLQYAKAHPMEIWPCPTAILYGERDNLTPARRQRHLPGGFAVTSPLWRTGSTGSTRRSSWRFCTAGRRRTLPRSCPGRKKFSLPEIPGN